jgi:sortase A
MRVIIGHRDLHFRGLGRVRPGDAVRVRGRDNAARSFRVCDVEILDRDTARRRLEERGTEPWLVMMTCYPFRFIGPAPARYLVWARECPGGSS